MRIGLVTANLEPGRDGIGDHCRRLAEALAAEGAETRLLAFADRAASDTMQESPALLRLPAALPAAARVAAGRAFLADCQGVALQLAPYLYDPKGLLGRAAPALLALLAGQRLQVTLHETWVGWYATHRLGDRLVGWRQRRQLLALLRRLAPCRLVTSLPVYAAQLAAAGLSAPGLAATVQPVFGNLPDRRRPHAGLAARIAAGAGAEALVVGLFGNPWAGWRPQATLRRVVEAARREGRRTLLLAIGGLESQHERLAGWAAEAGALLLETGPLPAEEADAALNLAHLALGVTPYDLAGKSSATAAWLERGVPVLTTWGAVAGPAPVAAPFQSLLLPPGADPAPLLRRAAGSGPFRPQVAESARALLDALRHPAAE